MAININLPIKKGTQERYDSIKNIPGQIQDNIIYICTDTGNVYFGKNQLCTTPTTVTVEDVVYNKENNSITIDYTGNKESTIIQLTTPTAVLGTF